MNIFTERDRLRYVELVQRQPLPLAASCEPFKKTRSNEQNALLFGVMYPPLAEAMGYDVDDVHEWMCGKFFGWMDRKVPKTPRNPEGWESKPFRTTTRDESGKRNVMSKSDFTKFIETVDRVAAKAGVFIPMDQAA